jgi:hypothetical protein
MTFAILIFLGALITSVLIYALLLIGLSEAEDSSQCRPEDMSDYEKRHVHRKDALLIAGKN